MSTLAAGLQVERLSKRFRARGVRGEVHAADDVSFAIAPGECVGLVGESGCGKSTLARLVARLLDASSGQIRFDGAPIGEIPARRFARSPERARIQMVVQDPADSLNPRFTVFRALADPLRRLNGLIGAELERRVLPAAELAGVAPLGTSRQPRVLAALAVVQPVHRRASPVSMASCRNKACLRSMPPA